MVVGAGIVGVASALWLARKGYRATIVDRLPAGQGASFGNAGVLAASSVSPVTAPGLISSALRHLHDPDYPLFVIWKKLPGLAPWLTRFLLHANDSDARRTAKGLALLITDSVSQHQDLARGTRAERWLVGSDYIYAYNSRRDFENDFYTWSLRDMVGFRPQIACGDEVAEIVPGLASHIRFLAALPEHGFVLNPGRYVSDLARTFEEMGGSLVRASVQGLVLENDRIAAVATDNGRLECTHAVIAAGAWSSSVLADLDISVPMDTLRGYHVLFREPSQMPPAPVLVSAGKFVMTPMSEGLRCAGIIEIGGLTAGPSRKPLELIRRQTVRAYPQLRWEETEEWLGHRPAPCDSLPFVGEIRSTRVFAAFGHQMIGLTSGPKTGRIVADAVAGNPSIVPLDAFDPMRFTSG